MAGRVQDALSAKEAARDHALDGAHRIVAAARRAIAAVHRGEPDACAAAVAQAREALAALERELAPHPDLLHGGLLDAARQEVAEAAIVAAYASGAAAPPAPQELGVPAAEYAQALGDVVGELRRLTLNALAHGEPDAALVHLRAMEAAFEALQTLDAPRGIADIKRGQDVARALLDRTLGEVTVGVAAARLQGHATERRTR